MLDQRTKHLALLLDLRKKRLSGFLSVIGALILVFNGILQHLNHRSGIIPNLSDIFLQHLVEKIDSNRMRRTSRPSYSVISPANVGIVQVLTVSRKHGRTAIAATQESGIVVLVLLYAAIVILLSPRQLLLGNHKRAIVNDGRMVILENDLLTFVNRHIRTVDPLTLIFLGTKCTNIEIVTDYLLYGYNAPFFTNLGVILIPHRLLASFLAHSWCGDLFTGQMIGDPLVPPTTYVEAEDLANHLGGGLVNLKDHFLGVLHHVAVRHRADPFALLLTVGNDCRYLFAGIGYGHFVDEEIELDLQPVVGLALLVVDGFTNRNDAKIIFNQVLKLGKPLSGTSRETAQILDDQYIILTAHKLRTKLVIVTRTLIKRVSGFIAVFVIVYRTRRKVSLTILSNNRLLVLDTRVVSVLFHVHRNTGISGNFVSFYHFVSPFSITLTTL